MAHWCSLCKPPLPRRRAGRSGGRLAADLGRPETDCMFGKEQCRRLGNGVLAAVQSPYADALIGAGGRVSLLRRAAGSA